MGRARSAARAGQVRAISVRVARLPTAPRELLETLALLGRLAPVRQLAAMSGAAPDAVTAALDVLSEAELVGHDGAGFGTAHDLVGATARDGIARALADEPGAGAERAHHLAGAGDRMAAAHAYAAAASERLGRFAHAEAGRLADAGLVLGPDERIRAELLSVRAAVREAAGDRDGARDDLRAALQVTPAGTDRSRILTRTAVLAFGADSVAHAADLIDLALTEAGDDPGARARALALGALVDTNVDRPARAEQRYREARALFERAGDTAGVADVRAMAGFLGGDVDGAVVSFDRVAQLFGDAGNLLRVVTPRSTRGHALVFADRAVAGLADIEEALDLARSLGYPDGEAYACWHHSEALTEVGRIADALQAAEQGLAIARRLGRRGWTATTLRARGVAHQAAGDTVAALTAFRASLAASEGLPLFECWAHARLGRVLLLAGHVAEAAGHVEAALRQGPPLGRYEARLARCALAVARDEPGAAPLIDDAITRARRGGHWTSLRELAAMVERVRARADERTQGDDAQP